MINMIKLGVLSKTNRSNQTRVTRYTFDALNRLSTVQDAEGNTTTYRYDAAGNGTFEVVNGVSTKYTLDANDRLVQTGGTIYTHDAQGNTLTETLDGKTTSVIISLQAFDPKAIVLYLLLLYQNPSRYIAT